MKTTSNTSLNDLFREAAEQSATDADRSVPTPGEVEQLLRNSNMRSVPVTSSIQQKLFERLLSTPLKIGLTAMTTATIVALVTFALWPHNNFQQPSAPSAVYSAGALHPAKQSNPAAIVSSHSQQTVYRSPEKHFVKANFSGVNETVPVASITTIDSLHPVDATPEELAKLGIVLEDNGDIDFYTKDGNEVNKFGLPPSWGVRLHLGEKISDAELHSITIQKTAPRLVTEPNGAKRLFSFESDTAFTQTNGGRRMHMRMQNQTEIIPGEQNPKIGEQNAKMGTALSSLSDSNVVRKGVNSRVSVTVSDSSITPEMTNSMVNLNIDSILSSINMDSILAAVASDSNLSSAQSHAIISMHSATNEHQIALKQVKKILSRMKISVDTSRGGTVRVEMNANDSLGSGPARSPLVRGAHSNTSVTVVRVNGGSHTDDVDIDNSDEDNSDLDESIPTPPIPPVMEMEQAANSLDLSKLIPIRVVNNKNPEHPNELIFWYAPTPDVEAGLPHQAVAVTQAAARPMSVSVYPNPTNGPVTVHYDLSNGSAPHSRAHFVVRNLLGQMVMDGGWSANETGDAALDFSRLDAGIYLFITTTEDGASDVERVVVAK
ncbi:MAG TPA: T9SS type A sorting domain-containing protein [Candidatus Kapabacteria bacterium]|nr:T9SS type A sorting domain-containing protein [Candidatus Kapabacteria bacterium]